MQRSESSEFDPQQPPRIGIPYRCVSEEQANDWEKIRPYAKAVEEAGGEPRLISLLLSPDEQMRIAAELDGLLLPGSPVDVDPARYREPVRPETTETDRQREQTDTRLLDWAFQEGKPVLSICYGTQLLNVHRGGTLVQDIRGELRSRLVHQWERERGAPEPHHPVRLVPGSLVAGLAETVETVVNSSHHQSIRRPGQGLRITAVSPDGVVEAVELESASHWVVGVQWHPERQHPASRSATDSGVRLSRALFRDLILAAKKARSAATSAQGAAEISKHSEER